MQKFRVALEEFTAAPQWGMGDTLTEMLIGIEDLGEKELAQGLDSIQALLKANEFVPKPIDADTARLVEMIKTKQLSPEDLATIRLGVAALKTGDQDIADEAMVKLDPDWVGVAGLGDFERVAKSLDQRRSDLVDDDTLKVLREAYDDGLRRSGFEIDGAFVVDTPPLEGPTVLLCHCTKSRDNISSILDGGLKTGKVGRLGGAIYASDSIEKALKYCVHVSLDCGYAIGIVFLVEMALGTSARVSKDTNQQPEGFDSCVTDGRPIVRNIPITFHDARMSSIPVPKENVKVSSTFPHNEYTVYTPERARVRFMLTVRRINAALPAPNTKRVEKTAPLSDLDVFNQAAEYKRAVLARRAAVERDYGVDSIEHKRVKVAVQESSSAESIFKIIHHL